MVFSITVGGLFDIEVTIAAGQIRRGKLCEHRSSIESYLWAHHFLFWRENFSPFVLVIPIFYYHYICSAKTWLLFWMMFTLNHFGSTYFAFMCTFIRL